MAEPRTTQLPLIFLTIASPLMLLVSCWRTATGQILFSLMAAAFPVALMALGGSRHGRLGMLRMPLAILLLLLVATVAAMLALRGRVADGPWLWGLPLAVVIQLGGIWLLPLLLVAWTYGRRGLSNEDLEALRRHCDQSHRES